VYQHGGLTVAAFEEPDSALLLAGLFITFISVQVRGRAVRARPPAPRRVIILATLLLSTPDENITSRVFTPRPPTPSPPASSARAIDRVCSAR
jgi:hypothetical protein